MEASTSDVAHVMDNTSNISCNVNASTSDVVQVVENNFYRSPSCDVVQVETLYIRPSVEGHDVAQVDNISSLSPCDLAQVDNLILQANANGQTIVQVDNSLLKTIVNG